jgi:hypothetical protein
MRKVALYLRRHQLADHGDGQRREVVPAIGKKVLDLLDHPADTFVKEDGEVVTRGKA